MVWSLPNYWISQVLSCLQCLSTANWNPIFITSSKSFFFSTATAAVVSFWGFSFHGSETSYSSNFLPSSLFPSYNSKLKSSKNLGFLERAYNLILSVRDKVKTWVEIKGIDFLIYSLGNEIIFLAVQLSVSQSVSQFTTLLSLLPFYHQATLSPQRIRLHCFRILIST